MVWDAQTEWGLNHLPILFKALKGAQQGCEEQSEKIAMEKQPMRASLSILSECGIDAQKSHIQVSAPNRARNQCKIKTAKVSWQE